MLRLFYLECCAVRAAVLLMAVHVAGCQLNADLDSYVGGNDAGDGSAQGGHGNGGGAGGQGGEVGQGGAGGQGGEVGQGGEAGAGGEGGGAGGSAGTGGSEAGNKPRRCTTDADCENSDADDGEHCRADGWCASKLFETVWKISSTNRTLVLPYYDDNNKTAKCDFTILWGDEGAGNDFSKGTHITDCSTKSNITHTYAAAGTYHVKIKGVYNGWGAGPYTGGECAAHCGEHVLKPLVEVVRFGPVGLTQGAFACTDGVKLPAGEVPDASLWHNGSQVFLCAAGVSETITQWDTSKVTDMSLMFFRVKDFDYSLSSWNITKVSNMTGMFYDASAFNQPLNSWDTSSVAVMSELFRGATAFNQPLDSWKTSNVTNMSRMFTAAAVFNQPLNTWNTSKVGDMSGMFWEAAAFNQPLDSWNTSNVTNMSKMFREAAAFDQNLSRWNVAKVEEMTDIFHQSGITKPNYCAVKSLPVWEDADLGVSFACP